jgi:hypothetical protein
MPFSGQAHLPGIVQIFLIAASLRPKLIAAWPQTNRKLGNILSFVRNREAVALEKLQQELSCMRIHSTKFIAPMASNWPGDCPKCFDCRLPQTKPEIGECREFMGVAFLPP